jgi:2-oxoglutarate ferredoxin oxidoreductase subunit alpha
VVSAEDEISAVNMAIGAGFAGVRAMTATSGSGFCLMTEGLGLAGITETPVVIIEGQRPGPAVGLPTRTEQGDLEFVIHAHQGDFPRVVLAPGNAEQAFWLTVKAFNLAEMYQVPVVVMTDHYLATSYFTVEPFDLAAVRIERGEFFTADGAPVAEYRRYRDTLSGVSPRAVPGMSEAVVCADADEHDEEGHLTEDAGMRELQMDKRMRKLHEIRGHGMAPPVLIGPKRADMTLISWGSNHGNIQEVIDLLREDGIKANFLHLSEIWPFPVEAVADVLRTKHPVYVIENNYRGQLAHLIQAETGRPVTDRMLKYDGRPFTPPELVARIKKCEGERWRSRR